jgi:hypothetical protein
VVGVKVGIKWVSEWVAQLEWVAPHVDWSG